MEIWNLPRQVRASSSDMLVVTDVSGLQIGRLEFQGRRPAMEDVCFTGGFMLGSHRVIQLGIFDGHGGSAVSTWLGNNFPVQLEKTFREMHKQRGGDDQVISGVAHALYETFSVLESLLRLETFAASQGSTACILVIMDGTLAWSAHCGDTRAVAVSVSGKGTKITIDHKPDLASETSRIVGLGGFVTPPPVSRVQGLLSLSRAFGDFSLSPFIISDPDMHGPFSLEKCGALVIGCDGVFDVLKDDEIAAMISYYCARGKMMDGLVQIRNCALTKGSTDNISLLCVNMALEPKK